MHILQEAEREKVVEKLEDIKENYPSMLKKCSREPMRFSHLIKTLIVKTLRV